MAGSARSGRERNYLADEEERLRKKKAFTSEAPRIGALASMRPSQIGSSSPGEMPEAPTSVGQIAQPVAFGREPPPSSADELEARVARNEGFLSSPETRAALLQFGISMMATAGRGNIGSNIGASLGRGMQAAGRVRLGQEARTEAERKAALDERQMQVAEGKLSLDELDLAAKLGEAGTQKFSRVIKGDDPLNQRFQLGLSPGESARVEFTASRDGQILNASVEAPFGEQPSTPDPTEITRLNLEADAAEAAGDSKKAAQLRQAAETKATGVQWTGTLKSGQALLPDEDSETGYKIVNVTGGDAEAEALAAAARAEAGKKKAQRDAKIIVSKTGDAIEMIEQNIAPDVFLTGWGDLLKYVPATQARDLDSTLATIKANIGFETLAAMRQASPTGGALGNVSNFEVEMLQSVVASMDQGMTAEQMLQNLKEIEFMYQDIIHGGLLTEIGKQVDEGMISEDDGLAQAAALFDPGGGVETVAPEDTGEEIPPLPKAYEDDPRVRDIWNLPTTTPAMRAPFLR